MALNVWFLLEARNASNSIFDSPCLTTQNETMRRVTTSVFGRELVLHCMILSIHIRVCILITT